ncbi:MAG: UDP-3-O-(3-hydroxymyristoyl)glucosamine N-acyltransferase, partial [Nitrospinae bacterium]|nr:UDP-3-O-(3-hydroxymyristoyl)glucosamine N-acyltransferase [Nitrospinota bacterium]
QVTVVGKSAVLRDLEGHSAYGGIPAVPLNVWRRSVTVLPKLPDLVRKIRNLESRLSDIEKKKGEE